MIRKKIVFKRLASILSVFLVLMPFINLSFKTASASSQVTHSSQSDFQTGNINDNLDSSSSPGNIKLKNNLDSYTESSFDDFNNGETSDTTIDPEAGNIKLAEGTNTTAYNTSSTPNLISNYINYSYLDPNTGLLYICTATSGVEVKDTHETADISDDTEVFNYTTSSTPASISENEVRRILIDSTNNLLYISTLNGLSVVDTQGTTAPTDDELVGIYRGSSSPIGTPNIPNGNIVHTALDSVNGLLYISTGNGLAVVSTQNTPGDTTDDTLVGRYASTSSPNGTPNLASDYTHYSFVDGDRIYIGIYGNFGYAGLYVINRSGTPFDLVDDVLENRFQWDPLAYRNSPDTQKSFLAGLFENFKKDLINTAAAAGPSFTDNSVNYASLQNMSENTLLYVGTNGNGLKVIDTHNTGDASDDTEVGQYSGGGNPDILSGVILSLYVNPVNEFLYIGTDRGISIVNTHGTLDLSDDSIEENVLDIYQDTNVLSSFVDPDSNSIYLSTYNNGVNIVRSDNSYLSEGIYTSRQINLDNNYSLISWDETKNSNQNVSMETRTASPTGVEELWSDEFNDNNTSNIYDYYEYFESFGEISESEGILTMTDPQFNHFTYTYIDSGFAENYFPAGSTVSARIRYVGSNATNVTAFLSTDDYEIEPDGVPLNNGEWVNITVTASQPFSIVEIDNFWDQDTWNSTTDKIEVDWVKVENTGSATWGDWSDSCTNSSGCLIEDTVGKESIQYRLSLSTMNSDSTPLVSSVTLSSGYQTTGDYVSSVINSGANTHWETLTSDQTVPDGTNIAFYTRTGNTSAPDGTWSDWQAVNSPISSPDGQYLQYKAVLSTSDDQYSPTLSSVTITYAQQSLNQENGNTNENSNQQSNNSYHAPSVAMGNNNTYTLTEDSITSVKKSNVILKGVFNGLTKGKVRIYKDGQLVGKGTTNNSGKWRIGIHPKINAVSTYQIKYFNSNGREVETTPFYQLIVDKSKPVIKIAKKIRASRGDTISWQVTDNDTVDYCKYSFRGKKYSTSNNSFIIPNTTPKGISKLKVTCFDMAGNFSSKRSNIFVQ